MMFFGRLKRDGTCFKILSYGGRISKYMGFGGYLTRKLEIKFCCNICTRVECCCTMKEVA